MCSWRCFCGCRVLACLCADYMGMVHVGLRMHIANVLICNYVIEQNVAERRGPPARRGSAALLHPPRRAGRWNGPAAGMPYASRRGGLPQAPAPGVRAGAQAQKRARAAAAARGAAAAAEDVDLQSLG